MTVKRHRSEAPWLIIASLAAACQGGGSAPGPAIQPALEAVLRTGTPPTFARRNPTTSGYQVLPTSATVLRLASGYPGSSDRMRVGLTPAGGTRRELAWVSRDDVPGKQARDAAGYYEIAVDNYGYSLIVTPAPAERNGPGFSVDVVNLSPGGSPAESAPLAVAIEPRSTVTAASAVFFDCGNDYDDVDGRWHWNCKNSSSIVSRDFALQGWLVGPGPNNLGGLWVEDYHYSFFPDPESIAEYYGAGGVFAALLGSAAAIENLILPGNPPATSAPVTLADRRPTGESRGITINSFLLPGNVADDRNVGIVKGELNAWHPAAQGSLWQRHWKGRGPAPAGWVTPAVDASDPNRAAWLNTSWPFTPSRPDGGADLVPGQYVRLFGPLWQDGAHDGPAGPNATTSPWSLFDIRLGAWLEIHPVDWMETAVVAPPVRKTPFVVAPIIYSQPTLEVSHSMAPDDAAQDSTWTLRCQEIIDGRYTDMASVTRRDVVLNPNTLEVTVAVARRVEPGPEPPPGQPRLDRIIPGRFKAVYLVWWEQGPAAAGCTAG